MRYFAWNLKWTTFVTKQTLLVFFITDCTRSVLRDKQWTFGKLLDEGDKVNIKQGKTNFVDHLYISQTSRYIFRKKHGSYNTCAFSYSGGSSVNSRPHLPNIVGLYQS